VTLNIREQIESDLATTLEDPNGYGLPVLLVDPDGVEYGPYYGQVLYDTRTTDELGVEIIQHHPVVTLRRSSLARIPLETEKNRWLVRIPKTPSLTATKETFVLGHPSEDGGSIGFIRLYLTKTVQS
jgi:hypothetical protein